MLTLPTGKSTCLGRRCSLGSDQCRRASSLRQILDSFLKHRSTSTTQPGGQQDESQLLTPPATQSTGRFHVLLGLTDHESITLPPNTISADQGEEFTPEPGTGEPEEMPCVVQDDGMVDKVKLVMAILVSGPVGSGWLFAVHFSKCPESEIREENQPLRLGP